MKAKLIISIIIIFSFLLLMQCSNESLYNPSDSGNIEYIPPNISITSPLNTFTQPYSFLITGTASDVSGIYGVEVRIDDDAGNYLVGINIFEFDKHVSVNNEETCYWYYLVDMTTCTNPDGLKYINCTAYDVHANRTSQTISVNIDNTYPTILITSPQHGKYINLHPLVEGTASSSANLQSVEVSTDNGNSWLAVTSDLQAWSTTLNLMSAPCISFMAKATDDSGKSTVTGPLIAALDQVLPVIMIISPTNNQTLEKINLVVTGTAYDNLDDDITIVLDIDGGNVTCLIEKTIVGTSNGMTYSWITSIEDVSSYSTSVPHSLTAIVTDIAGNVTYNSISINFDNVPPVLGFISPTNGSGLPEEGTIKINGTVTDNFGVHSVVICVDGADVGGATFNNTSWEMEYSVGASDSSDHTILVTCFDTSGNEGTSSVTNLKIIPDWEDDPMVTNNLLKDISIISSTQSFIVGWDATILYYDGANWTNTELQSQYNLNSVSMLSEDNGWSVGADGTILHFDGTSWISTTSNTSEDLRSVYFVDDTHGWCVGDNGTILKCDGTTWSDDTSSITEDIFSVYMLDSTTGWAVGSDGIIIYYDGSSWGNVQHPTSIILRSVYMLDSATGWAVGEHGTILKYNGSSWSVEQQVTDKYLCSVRMIDSTTGWAVGEHGTILYYLNGTWIPLIHIYQESFFSIGLLDTENAWIVGSNGRMLKLKTVTG